MGIMSVELVCAGVAHMRSMACFGPPVMVVCMVTEIVMVMQSSRVSGAALIRVIIWSELQHGPRR